MQNLKKEKCELLGIIQGKDEVTANLKEQKASQLTKAKELIEELSSSLSVVGECEEEECELLNRAEQFISEVEKK